MPNAGIQACRSTNWKSADAASNRLQSSSVSREHQQRHDERDVAHQRRAPLVVAGRTAAGARRRPAARRARCRIGKCINASIIATGSTPGSPRRRGTATPHTRAPIRSAAAAAARSAPATVCADAVDRAVDDAHVHALPQRLLGDDLDRLHDGGVVDLVDVVLVQQQRVHARRSARAIASAARRFVQEEVDGDADAGDRDGDRDEPSASPSSAVLRRRSRRRRRRRSSARGSARTSRRRRASAAGRRSRPRPIRSPAR